VELLVGAMIDYYPPQNKGADLEAATTEFIQASRRATPTFRLSGPVPFNWAANRPY